MVESDPPLADGDLNFEKMSTPELQAWIREKKAEGAGAPALAVEGLPLAPQDARGAEAV
jgi:hypothetical protein